jgi:hypothetical protein
MKKILILALLCLIWGSADAQQKFTLSGYLKDKSNGEAMIGATIYVVETGGGAAANTYGYYSLTLPSGIYHLKISSLGYTQQPDSINLINSFRRDYLLTPSAEELKEVTVTAEGAREQVQKTQMGRIDISIQQAKKLPVLFGEVDIMKTLQLLPGVQSGSEGTTGFYVRGGGPDQNLILLDGAVVYNASFPSSTEMR